MTQMLPKAELAQLSAAQLADKVRACTICKDLPLGPDPLFQYGAQAPILLAGHAPGRKTHVGGRPFADASGVRLRSWLGVSAAQFYDPNKFAILPMGFCYPGTQENGRGDLAPRRICAQSWRSALLEKMPQLELTLCLGKYAQDWHDPVRPRRNVTQRAKDYNATLDDMAPAQAFLPHPSPRNNLWLAKNPWFEADLLPVLRKRIAKILSH